MGFLPWIRYAPVIGSSAGRFARSVVHPQDLRGAAESPHSAHPRVTVPHGPRRHAHRAGAPGGGARPRRAAVRDARRRPVASAPRSRSSWSPSCCGGSRAPADVNVPLLLVMVAALAAHGADRVRDGPGLHGAPAARGRPPAAALPPGGRAPRRLPSAWWSRSCPGYCAGRSTRTGSSPPSATPGSRSGRCCCSPSRAASTPRSTSGPCTWPRSRSQFAFDGANSLLIECVGLGVPVSQLRTMMGAWVIDALLSPVALAVAYAGAHASWAALLGLPLAALLGVFARQRREGLDAALELSAAYRRTAVPPRRRARGRRPVHRQPQPPRRRARGRRRRPARPRPAPPPPRRSSARCCTTSARSASRRRSCSSPARSTTRSSPR